MIGKEVKNLLTRIVESKNGDDAINNVFYGSIENPGIDLLFQRGKITWDEHQLLLAIINKMK